MIRLTVEQLMALRDSLQGSGQVQCAVLPLQATYVHRLIIAWAKGRAGGEEYYLSIWRDAKTLEDERAKEEAGEKPPYDFINDQGSMEYSHTYPVEDEVEEPARHFMQLDSDGKPYRLVVTDTGRFKTSESFSPGAADSGHPEFGVTYDE